MKIHCPNPKCVLSHSPSLSFRPIVRNGSSFRKSDSRKIQCYHCRLCRCYFSKATFDRRYQQKKRRFNPLLYSLLNSGVSQRRAARILNLNRKTVVRRLRFLAMESRGLHSSTLKPFSDFPLDMVQFDELETSIHLSFQVSDLPAKGHLAKIARRKYGKRPDRRFEGLIKLFYDLKPYVSPLAHFTSDENPHYPRYLKLHHPQSTHLRVPGGRGAITGQGELKKLRFDPLFSLNRTCAMLRANLNRLFRKTWCTSKTTQGLIDHLSIYAHYHNTQLTRFSDASGAS